jgi:PAS domain S-box-containing protein
MVCLTIDFATMMLLRQLVPSSSIYTIFFESILFISLLSLPFYYFFYRPFLNLHNNSTEVLNEFETLLRTTTEGFWITDIKNNGEFLYVNDAYCNMIGYTRKELLQMNIRDVDPVESMEEMKSHFKKIIETGHDRFVTCHRTKSGNTLEIEVSVTYLNINGGRFYAFLNDITQEQKLKRNTIVQNEKLYEISSLQSHQVRAPITNILGIINLINFENPNDPENIELILALKTATVDFDSINREIVKKTYNIPQLTNTVKTIQ